MDALGPSGQRSSFIRALRRLEVQDTTTWGFGQVAQIGRLSHSSLKGDILSAHKIPRRFDYDKPLWDGPSRYAHTQKSPNGRASVLKTEMCWFNSSLLLQLPRTTSDQPKLLRPATEARCLTSLPRRSASSTQVCISHPKGRSPQSAQALGFDSLAGLLDYSGTGGQNLSGHP
jgi:hypothetical protein